MESTRRRGHSFIEEDLENLKSEETKTTQSPEDDGPPAYDPSQTFEDDNDDEPEDFNEDNEEEYFSRTRSRSRSVHENDDVKVKTLSEEEIKSKVEHSKNHCTERNIETKTGPLHHREVVALQQVGDHHFKAVFGLMEFTGFERGYSSPSGI